MSDKCKSCVNNKNGCSEMGYCFSPMYLAYKPLMSEQKDRPEVREKLTGLELYSTSGNFDICEFKEGHTHLLPTGIDKILALFPDEEEAKREERERILALIESYNSIDYAYGAEYKEAILQALKEEVNK